MDLDVEAALVKTEAWEAWVVALSRADPASPYRRLWAADCKRAVVAWVAQGDLILDTIG